MSDGALACAVGASSATITAINPASSAPRRPIAANLIVAAVPEPEPVNVWDYERLAADRLEPGVHGYFAGGAGDERTLRDNVAAFTRRTLHPRVLVDVSAVTTATTVLGTDISMPLLVAPVAFQRLVDPDGEVGMARAAAGAGTIMCLSTLATAHPSEVAAEAPPAPRWFQLYCFSDRGVTRSMIDEAVECGYEAIVLTVDAPRAGRRERDFRTGFARPRRRAARPAVAAAVGSERADQPTGGVRAGRPDAHLEGARDPRRRIARCRSSSRGFRPAPTRRSRSSTARERSSSPTTAGASSTGCRRRWTFSPRLARRSTGAARC